jgi:hypothetical protein
MPGFSCSKRWISGTFRQAYPKMPAAIEAVVRNLVVQETPATKAARI